MNVTEDACPVPPSAEHFISTTEACRVLRCTERTIRTIMKRGELPVTKVMGHNRFNYWDVVRLVGTLGRHEKSRKNLLDKRTTRDTLRDITVE